MIINGKVDCKVKLVDDIDPDEIINEYTPGRKSTMGPVTVYVDAASGTSESIGKKRGFISVKNFEAIIFIPKFRWELKKIETII